MGNVGGPTEPYKYLSCSHGSLEVSHLRLFDRCSLLSFGGLPVWCCGSCPPCPIMAARPPAQRSPTLSPAAARPRRAESGSNQRPSRRGHHAARSPPSSSSSPSDSDMDEPWEPPRAPNQHARPAPTPPTPSQARRHREKSRVDEDSDMDEPWEPPRPANQPTRDVHSPRHPPAGRRQRHRDDEDSEMDEPWEPPKPPREQQREPSAAPQPSPARRSRDIPIDPALLESDDEPYDPPTPRPPPRWPRFDPVDDALRSQGQTRSVYSVARPSPLNPKVRPTPPISNHRISDAIFAVASSLASHSEPCATRAGAS